MSFTADQIHAGQAVYTRPILKIYDLAVLGLSNRLIWKCPTQRLVEHYNKHVTFVDKCRFRCWYRALH